MIEDIFAENLVDEPDDIERVIEDGGELMRDSGKSDGGSDEDDKKKDQEEKEKEKPKIRKTMGPRPVLNAQRLKGPRGIATMEEFFSGLKLDGQRGKEEQDLDVVMKRLELWTHRLYPRGQFDDCLKKIEKLGTNKIVRNYITRIRLGMEDEGGESDIIREEPNSPPPAPSHEDPFDQLMSSSPGPVVTSGPHKEMTTEQRERMLRNRLIAEEKRAARIKKAQELKEKFKAQQALHSQSVNEVVSSLEPPRSDTQEHRLENSEVTLEMEVDDNPNTTRVSDSIDKAIIENKLSDETVEGKNEYEIQEKENKRNETYIGVADCEDRLEKITDQVTTSQDVEAMSIDHIDPQVCSHQEDLKSSSEENISLRNLMKQNEIVATEEKDNSIVSSSEESLTTVNHIFQKEETLLKEKAVIPSLSNVNEKERLFLNDQEENGEPLDSFEKENENPNN